MVAVLQVGNLCSILATKDPSVGLSIAYPIMQCGLFVGGLWGICLFKELKGRGQVCLCTFCHGSALRFKAPRPQQLCQGTTLCKLDIANAMWSASNHC